MRDGLRRRSYPSVKVRSVRYAGTKERLRGPDADRDGNAYNVVWLSEPRGEVPAGKYLVDDSGHIKYLEDPGNQRQESTPATNGEKVKSKIQRAQRC